MDRRGIVLQNLVVWLIPASVARRPTIESGMLCYGPAGAQNAKEVSWPLAATGLTPSLPLNFFFLQRNGFATQGSERACCVFTPLVNRTDRRLLR